MKLESPDELVEQLHLTTLVSFISFQGFFDCSYLEINNQSDSGSFPLLGVDPSSLPHDLVVYIQAEFYWNVKSNVLSRP